MRLVLDRPFDLAATLGTLRHGRFDPATRLTPGELWWATRTAEGPGTLRLDVQRRVGTTVVHAEAWGPGRASLLRQVPELLGEHDDTSTFTPHHPVVARAWRRHPGLRIGRSCAVVPELVASVLAQRVTSIESTRGWASLCRLLGGRAPGPIDLRLPPDPAALAAKPSWWYHRLGIERHRADTLRRVGLHAARLEEAASMPLPDAHRRLRAVRGIGAWTAAEVAGPALGDADAVSIGDYHLPNIVSWALAGEARADDARMLELLAPFAGHRGRVIRLLGADGHRAPKFGPRQAILPIAAL